MWTYPACLRILIPGGLQPIAPCPPLARVASCNYYSKVMASRVELSELSFFTRSRIHN